MLVLLRAILIAAVAQKVLFVFGTEWRCVDELLVVLVKKLKVKFWVAEVGVDFLHLIVLLLVVLELMVHEQQ